MNESTSLRSSTPADRAAIVAVHRAAFPTAAESQLVERLFDGDAVRHSFIASIDGRVVGNVMFSAVTVDGASNGALGLAPLAVLEPFRKRGIGAALVRRGLEAANASNTPFVVLLGEPGYYARFGFEPASRFGLTNEYGVDAEFMVVETFPRGLAGRRGVVRYRPEFAGL